MFLTHSEDSTMTSNELYRSIHNVRFGDKQNNYEILLSLQQ